MKCFYPRRVGTGIITDFSITPNTHDLQVPLMFYEKGKIHFMLRVGSFKPYGDEGLWGHLVFVWAPKLLEDGAFSE